MRIPMIRRLGLSLLVALLACGSAQPQEHLKGKARWEWVVTDSKGKETKGTFMGYVTGEVKHGKEQQLVGHWKAVGGDRVQATFDKGPLTGTIDVKQTKAKIPTYVGEYVPKDGTKEKIVIELYKD